MSVFQLSKQNIFPDPNLAETNGLLAIGGDLLPNRLLNAYYLGIFPWFNRGEPIMWWSPNPRCISIPGNMKISKSLKQIINRKTFNIKTDTCFNNVILHCAKIPRKEGCDTWITPNMIKAYQKLHNLGYAHSVEVFNNSELVGGLYGVSIGKAFFGESMFSLQPNASKVAYYYLHKMLQTWDFGLIDNQLVNPHLTSLGAIAVERDEFLKLLSNNVNKATMCGKWDFNF